MSIHESDIEAVSEASTEPVASRRREPVVALLVALLIAIISIAVQQIIFYQFVQEVGGRPDGLFKTSRGAYYELWSFTVPLWITNIVMLLVGIGWAVRFHRLGYRWFTIAMWIAYVAILWSLMVASSGLVQILGKGEVFI
jgi:hypothetical protein